MSSEDQHADNAVRMDAAGPMRAVWVRLPRILLVTVLLVAATFAILLLVPRTYESAASLLVEPISSAATAVDTDALVASHIELIMSHDLLLDVVDSRNLRSVPEVTWPAFNPPPESPPSL